MAKSQVSRSALTWASMLPPQCQDYALSFIAKRLAIQVPSKALDMKKCDDFFSSSLSRYIPFIKQLSDKTFPLPHVSMKTLLEVVVLQLRALVTAVETIDESTSQLDLDEEASHAAEALRIINVSLTPNNNYCRGVLKLILCMYVQQLFVSFARYVTLPSSAHQLGAGGGLDHAISIGNSMDTVLSTATMLAKRAKELSPSDPDLLPAIEDLQRHLLTSAGYDGKLSDRLTLLTRGNYSDDSINKYNFCKFTDQQKQAYYSVFGLGL